jgi:hypothetical protein
VSRSLRQTDEPDERSELLLAATPARHFKKHRPETRGDRGMPTLFSLATHHTHHVFREFHSFSAAKTRLIPKHDISTSLTLTSQAHPVFSISYTIQLRSRKKANDGTPTNTMVTDRPICLQPVFGATILLFQC